MLLLTASELAAVISPSDAILHVERALAALSGGDAVVPERLAMSVPSADATVLSMPAFVEKDASLGVKLVSVYPRNRARGKPTVSGLYVLLDVETGKPLALLDGGMLTAIRTGAVVGLATRELARENAETLALIGTGVQGFHSVKSVLAVRDIREVRLHNRTPKAAKRCAEKLRELFGSRLRLSVEKTAENAVVGADIVITATTSAEPVVSADVFAPGTHVNALGAFRPWARELPGELVARADKLVVEHRASALSEAGDLLIPIKQDMFRADEIHAELGEICRGLRVGRETPEELTIFKSVGHAAMDVVVAKAAYDAARRKGVGAEVHFP